MEKKEAVAVIRSNWPDLKYSMLREALDLAIKSLETDDREICASCICGHYQPTQGTRQDSLQYSGVLTNIKPK